MYNHNAVRRHNNPNLDRETPKGEEKKNRKEGNGDNRS
jgi:hypothetical protein